MAIHICPVGGKRHEVHPVLDGLACGNQLTCSARCKTEFPQVVRERRRAEFERIERAGWRHRLADIRSDID